MGLTPRRTLIAGASLASQRDFAPVAFAVAVALAPLPDPINAQVAGSAGKLEIAASEWKQAKDALAR